MDQKQQQLFELRKKLMQQRKVVCTGNPDRPGTLASGFKKLFPGAVFLSRSHGWDLSNMDPSNESALSQVFKNCNTFLNCSHIGPGVQSKLLQICQQSVKFCDVINIGSSHEYDNLGEETYKKSKLDLRYNSLALNTFRFSTSHVILGGIKKDNSEGKANWLDIDLICNTIIDLWNKPYKSPILAIDQFKEPW